MGTAGVAGLAVAFAATACDDLIRAGRAAAGTSAEAAPTAQEQPPAEQPGAPAPRAEAGERDAPQLLGEPAWEGERSAVGEELGEIFAEERVEGVVVVHDLRTGATLRSDGARAARRFPPAGTFDIPLGLIALESGAVAGAYETVAPADGHSDAEPTNLATAFRTSPSWFTRELSHRIGGESLRAWLRRIGYGNADAGDAEATFWLTGPLAISADEQIGFLRRLQAGQLPFSTRAQDALRELMVLERGDGWLLRGKTGWQSGRHDRLWFVGWVERGEEAAFFAIEFENATRGRDVGALRERIYRRVLTQLGLVPARR
ncbi:MAG TPA: penicillin-binding transpeptidase domain-containing protein [Longimicrobiales bacterium]|nr:penicillin-binding transpeptidase domain-containing protein [Longimicrobiales bacterium]